MRARHTLRIRTPSIKGQQNGFILTAFSYNKQDVFDIENCSGSVCVNWLLTLWNLVEILTEILKSLLKSACDQVFLFDHFYFYFLFIFFCLFLSFIFIYLFFLLEI